METLSNSANPGPHAPAPGEALPAAPGPATSSPAEPLPMDAATARLHYLFRRTAAKHQPHVLMSALFEYRGIHLP